MYRLFICANFSEVAFGLERFTRSVKLTNSFVGHPFHYILIILYLPKYNLTETGGEFPDLKQLQSSKACYYGYDWLHGRMLMLIPRKPVDSVFFYFSVLCQLVSWGRRKVTKLYAEIIANGSVIQQFPCKMKRQNIQVAIIHLTGLPFFK